MKTLPRLALVSVLLALLAFGAGVLWLARSLPSSEGRRVVDGISARVEIVRDANGVPHILAATRADAHFGLGFAHAQDRLWQMEFARRLGAGRLAEILGADALASDRVMRTLGIGRVAAANLRFLDADTRRLIDAYVAGINAFLDAGDPLPPEFTILRHAPEPWTAADPLLWPKLMALDLDGNWRSELARLALSRRLTPEQTADFLPPYTDREPRGAAFARASEAPLPSLATPRPPGIGSNAWAIAGGRTRTGKPLLANDPHLALQAPSLWYLAHLSWPDHDVVGATIPGLPTVVLGRNRRIAWAMTNTGSDLQDLYLEKSPPGDPERYLTPSGPRRFEIRHETIKVRGGEDVAIRIRESRHGPVLSDLFEAGRRIAIEGHVMALAWTALEPRDLTMKASFGLATATDWRSFNATLSDYHAPQQSFLYADVDGDIGFLTPGRTPLRSRDNEIEGVLPQPGWEAKYDWLGYLPFEALPRKLNPPSQTLVNANHKVVEDDYPHHLTHEWGSGLRARRIAELLSATPRLGIDDVAAMQSDVLSPLARELLGLLRRAAAEDGQATELLADWDGRMAADRPAPLIFAAWYRELTRLVYGDELGPLFPRLWGGRSRFMLSVLKGDKARWCDDVTTKSKEDCEAIARLAFDRARASLVRRHGIDLRKWRWGKAHVARHAHRPFSAVPILGRFFDLSVGAGGDGYTINALPHAFGGDETLFPSAHGPSFRAIYDLSDLDNSRFILPTGQSGHPLSSRYRNMAEAWSRGEYVKVPTARARFEAAPSERLVLEPRGAR